jgi:hypothetical protein
MSFENPGGGGALLVLIAPPVIGGIAGAVVGGPKHRVLGAAAGVGAGIVGVLLLARINNASNQAALQSASSGGGTNPTIPANLQSNHPKTAWQLTPWGDASDPNSPAYACAQAIQEGHGSGGPWSQKCNDWRNQ